MNSYRMIIQGENIMMNIIDKDESTETPSMAGFFTTRWMDAKNESDAERKAIDGIRNELKDKIGAVLLPNINIKLVRTEQIGWWEGRFRKNAGFTFYMVNQMMNETGD